MDLPESILRLTEEQAYTMDRTGMSGASIRLYKDRVLKIQPWGPEAENEAAMLAYLQGKLPVPKLYIHEREEGTSYLLMDRCRGRMACHPAILEDPAALCALLAAGLRQLWSVDVSRCPCDQRLEKKLEAARYNVENGLVDMDNVEPGSIILLHDIYPTSVDAALRVVDRLQEEGYWFVTVEELLWLNGVKPEAGRMYRSGRG